MFYFVRYYYRECILKNIKSFPHTGETSKARLSKVTNSNTWYYKNYRTFLLQIFFISRRMPIGTSIRTISSHFLILVTSKPRLFKVTTSNTWYYKNYRTFLLQNIFYFASYAYRDFNGNHIKSLPHTGDLQTKTFQGHYLKHVILQELQNISFTNIFYFVRYYYRECILKNIKSFPHTGETSKARLSKVTNSNTWYYKNCRTFFLQISFILYALLYILFLTSKTYQDMYQSYTDIISTKSEK